MPNSRRLVVDYDMRLQHIFPALIATPFIGFRDCAALMTATAFRKMLSRVSRERRNVDNQIPKPRRRVKYPSQHRGLLRTAETSRL